MFSFNVRNLLIPIQLYFVNPCRCSRSCSMTTRDGTRCWLADRECADYRRTPVRRSTRTLAFSVHTIDRVRKTNNIRRKNTRKKSHSTVALYADCASDFVHFDAQLRWIELELILWLMRCCSCISLKCTAAA